VSKPPKEQIRRRNRGPDVGDVQIAENLAHPLLWGNTPAHGGSRGACWCRKLPKRPGMLQQTVRPSLGAAGKTL
jgi:hypothetical protein